LGSSWVVKKRAASFNAKTAKKSANASPASPVNTRTAERAFARNHPNFHQQKTRFLLMKMKPDLSGWLSVLPCCIAALSLTLIALASKP